MRQQFAELMQDIESSISLGNDAFGGEPEAVNLWLGDDWSVSSMHKDHYENLYCVVQGEKTFTLLPPVDIAFLPERTLPTFEYKAHRKPGDEPEFAFTLQTAEPAHTKRWICLDPEADDASGSFPRFKHAHPLRCTVSAGQTLYLPALW
jgi:jumonji domain-containing protein 7